MEPNDDTPLRELLREWQAPDAPPSLDARVLGRRRSLWNFLLSGHIRVPVPVGFALMAVLLIMAFLMGRHERPPVTAPPHPVFNLRDFQPVQDAQVRVIRREDAGR